VTGFLAFEGFEFNPSATIAERCGRPFALIEVSYAAVDDYLASLDASRFDQLLLTGVAGRSTRMRVERFARNVVDARVDVRHFTRGPGPIDPLGLAELRGTLWTDSICDRATDVRCGSDDAGGYLCNYIYYRALQMFPGKRVGFLHVAPEEHLPIDRQLHVLSELLAELEGERVSAPFGYGESP